MSQSTTLKGLTAGALMSIVLIMLGVSGYTGGGAISYLKYIPLAFILGMYLNTLASQLEDFHKHALTTGLKLSAIAGGVIALVNVMVFVIRPSFSISKFNLSPSSISGALAVSGTMIFEVIVFGMILSFIFFQAFKNRAVSV